MWLATHQQHTLLKKKKKTFSEALDARQRPTAIVHSRVRKIKISRHV